MQTLSKAEILELLKKGRTQVSSFKAVMDDIESGKMDVVDLSSEIEVPENDTGSCKDVLLVLTPLDWSYIVRGKNVREVLLDVRPEMHVGPSSGMPLLLIEAQHYPGRNCPFLDDSEKKCKLHVTNRPGVCRVFPLGRVSDGFSNGLVYTKPVAGQSTVKMNVKEFMDTREVLKVWSASNEFMLGTSGTAENTPLMKLVPDEEFNDLADMMFQLDRDIGVDDWMTEVYPKVNEVLSKYKKTSEELN